MADQPAPGPALASSETPRSILSLRDVRKHYGVEVVTEVLHGVDLELHEGEFAALVGPSGSGKSTLLNVMGLLDRPSAGSILIDRRETSALSEDELTLLRGDTIGFIFQFHHLLPAFTALENVMLPMYARARRPSDAMRDRARTLLERVGLGDKLERKASKLSGGQQQRVAIARALINAPALVLADEPTGNLDTESADQVFALLRAFNREQKSALLVVTHDPRLAQRCDRVIELVDGRVVSDQRNDG
jgi:lipoprotein-releasing system ATP-binding protein